MNSFGQRALRPAALLVLLGWGVLLGTPARGQVSVAPTALFLNDQERFGALYITNQSNAPQEVTVGFRFGYPDTDSLGNIYIEFEDSLLAEKHSVAPHIRAFPERFILPPAESQVVRLMARPPSDLAEGTYWTRVLTTSTPQVPFQDTTTTGISARVLFRLQQVTALFYRKGEPSATISIGNMAVEADSQGVSLYAQLDHAGNSPFLGSAIVRVYDEGGRVISETRQSVAAYVSSRRRFALELPPAASSGSYVAELTLTPERTDIPPAQLLRTPPTSFRTSFAVK